MRGYVSQIVIKLYDLRRPFLILQPTFGGELPPPIVIPRAASLVVKFDPPVPAKVRLLSGPSTVDGFAALLRSREATERIKEGSSKESVLAFLNAPEQPSDSPFLISGASLSLEEQTQQMPPLPDFVEIKEGMFVLDLVSHNNGPNAPLRRTPPLPCSPWGFPLIP